MYLRDIQKKQWGIKDPMELDKSDLNRIPFRVNNNTEYYESNFVYKMSPQKI